MKKKILLTLMVMVLSIIALGTISVSAATSGTCGTNLTWTLNNGTLTINGQGDMDNWSYSANAPWYSSKANITKVVIGDRVTSIGDYAFSDCSSLTSVTIPDGVTSIGNYAFSDCSSLTSATIPDSVTNIGYCVFTGCDSLTSVTIPDSVISIGANVFLNCNSLTSINVSGSNKNYSSADGVLFNKDKTALIRYPIGKTNTSYLIPDSVTSIGGQAFYNCDSLTSITIPDSVTDIDNSAFSDCSSLTSVIIPDSVTHIGDYAFRDCTSLKCITIPDSVTDIEGYAFYNTAYYKNSSNWENNALYIGNHLIRANTTIRGEYNIKEGTITIAGCAFYNCSNLTSITIPDSVTSIASMAFYNCSSLTSITIPDSVTSIGVQAFYNCTSLKSITIPDSVTSIGRDAFNNTRYYNNSSNWENNVLYIGNHLIEAKTTLRDEYSIKEGTITIAGSAFYNCSNLTSITIPDSVTSIASMAFYNCTSLTMVYYNGNQEDWNEIAIVGSNFYLEDATKNFFYYVTLIDEDGNIISKKTYDINSLIDISHIEISEGYGIALCKDKELTEFYDLNTPIAENLTLYVDFIKLNKIDFEGTATADIGEKGITQGVSFTTDKTAKYFSCTLKVPNSLEVQEIKSDIFEIEQDYEVIGNDTHYYLFLIYNGDGNIPTYQTLNAFEVVFDISENAVADEMLTIEILDDAILADDNGNSYDFTSIGKAEIKVNPIFAEKITIVGTDEIDVPTQYTISVLPENATNQNVEWSVSDETIATISEDGVLTPVKKGNVTVRATAKDGSGVYAEKTVSVKVLGTVNSITTNIGIWDKEYSPDTTNYTIYVPESTTSIRLTAKHDGTFKTDKTTFVNNVTRTVTLSTTSDETVLDLVYTCEGYDNNKYTITIIKFEGTKTEVSEDKKSFSITPINVENGKTVILALYNGEQFVEMQSAVYTGEVVPFTTTKTYTKAKVMVWDDLTTLKPVCEVENIQ